MAIDTTVANASRIVALVGTLKVKGDATPDRPHRRSALASGPPELVPVPRERLEALAPPRPAVEGRDQGRRRPDAGRLGEGLFSTPRGPLTARASGPGRTWYRLESLPVPS